MSRSVIVVVNPAAGKGRAASLWQELRPDMKRVFREIQVVTTERPGHARRVAGDVRVDLILAVGGDGTISEVASGILERDGRSPRPILGILAAGRGNDFRRSVGSRISAAQLAHKLATETPPPVDAGRISFAGLDVPDDYFINIAGVGFEPEVLKTAESEFRRLPRALGYLAAMLATLRTYENAQLELRIDDRTLNLKANSVLVANGRFFAQGMHVAPDADIRDGLFDIVVVGNLGRLPLILTYPLLYLGRHISHPKVGVVRARRVEIRVGRELAVEADGELRGILPAIFEIVPRALRVIA